MQERAAIGKLLVRLQYLLGGSSLGWERLTAGSEANCVCAIKLPGEA
jgi:hypothetical protein